ncbi:pentatricopeptide repeat-containing protein At5g16860 [Punica granatum]|uniref:Pentatricopeptide repeat-containing protein At5g16860 n=2 Tax=Punica granatum TaxID=22663 RepID=A0A6P8EMS8_PUNGR|nr:pentatricopeptide repeat-containing protein At5g16860 [Punica granatum]XP_031406516.1 pentatricopeptide repeat-containing protein At5g16860 [Punica granatum]OWM62666.1 hypothetical protein CDL15_Pgr019960 [Punica granatum]PKI53483.1 hypothetical protein CRG98_026173 [Punica granatum]
MLGPVLRVSRKQHCLLLHWSTGRAPISSFSNAEPTASPPLITVQHLQECSSLLRAKLLHQQVLVQGLTHLSTRIIGAYITSDAPAHALCLLKRTLPCDFSVFWWNMLIRRSVHLGLNGDVLGLFRDMMRLGWQPDHYTFPFVVKACGDLPSLRAGASVHGLACGLGFDSNVFVSNSMVAMYGRCGELDTAKKMFDEMLARGITDVVSWNSIVAAYIQAGDAVKAIDLFDRMVKRMMSDFSIRPDVISLANILPAIASVGSSERGKQVHCYAIRSGLFKNVFVGNALLDMYAKCAMLKEANRVFEQMRVKDVVSWNAMVTGYSQVGRFNDALSLFEKMEEQNIELDVVTWTAVIAGYAQRGHGYEALDVFRRMQLSRSEPNVITFVSLLSGCASAGALINGKEIHCYAIKRILNHHNGEHGDDIMVLNALIDMYAKCKSTATARFMFDLVPPKNRDVVMWTAMIGGYAQHGDANHALELFSELVKKNYYLKPNAFTMSCALMACSRLATLRFGKEIHAYMVRNQYRSVVHVNNCLMDMYCKSADISSARIVFDHMRERNDVSWTTLMTCYGMHGRGEEALWVFEEMKKAGLVFDGVTFIVVLYACSHSGLVDQGMEIFNAMEKDFGVVPRVEHYASMVDLLGRSGRLGEAMKLIKNMPLEPTLIVWVALLSACRVHGNVEFGEYAANKLLELGCENDGSYTLLSNIYANARRWKDVARIRSLMRHTGIKKRPGCSWVQGKKGTVSFFVGDRTHPRSEEICNLLADLIERIRAIGYVPQTSFALHDVDDEEKGDLLSEHSEKLALAYGILTSAPGVPIRITKNLRVCGDCHSAFTYISIIVDHEIIVRDSSRFHHFKKGSCSCRGYW